MSEPTQFANKLLSWHNTIDRRLPWKLDRNPYKIWLSEIIMQQTRVAQGTPYYLKFVDAYPTITDLANAPEAEIMKLWQGLGYYSRARNLHHTAKAVRDDFGGSFPTEYKDILSLKGVGKYTAAAIASFAYGLEYPVVDGNVLRVFSRYYGITAAIDATDTIKDVNIKAARLIKGSDPAKYNQAIMDFGALYCKPKNPFCEDCTYANECIAFQKDMVSSIPYKAKKIKKRTRYFHFFIIESVDHVLIHHRTQKDIWQSLFDYPNIENHSDAQLSESEIFDYLNSNLKLHSKRISYPTKIYKHILTHQTLFGQFYKVEVEQLPIFESPYLTIPKSELTDYAMPVLLTNYTTDEDLFLF